MEQSTDIFKKEKEEFDRKMDEIVKTRNLLLDQRKKMLENNWAKLERVKQSEQYKLQEEKMNEMYKTEIFIKDLMS